MSKYTPNAVVRGFIKNRLIGLRQQAPPDGNAEKLDFELSLTDIAMLELLAFYSEPQQAYDQFTRLDYENGFDTLYESVCKTEPLQQAEYVQIYIGKRSVRCTGFIFDTRRSTNFLHKMDLTAYAVNDPRVALSVLLNKGYGLGLESVGFASYGDFLKRVQALQEAGFILPDIGALNWGDLRRQQPFCQFFGFMRGTPIADYYLNRFVESIRESVRGITLEIGGEKKNRELYGFRHVTEYRILDLPGLSEDIAGDASDPNILSENTFDSIVIFNVLEHCEKPQVVVDNIHRWLKPGGKAFVLVPCAQRVHPAPGDYWRPLPQALQSLFKAYSKQQIRTYGNITTVIASFHGIAAEELSTEEMDFNHPDYPVISCIVAEK